MASNPGEMDPELARRIAENEARFRAANEKIEGARLRLEADPITVPFVCECVRHLGKYAQRGARSTRQTCPDDLDALRAVM